MITLEGYIRSIVNLDNETLQQLASLFKEKNVKKSSSFAEKGEFAKKIAFIQSGILRAYHANEEGLEYI